MKNNKVIGKISMLEDEESKEDPGLNLSITVADLLETHVNQLKF